MLHDGTKHHLALSRGVFEMRDGVLTVLAEEGVEADEVDSTSMQQRVGELKTQLDAADECSEELQEEYDYATAQVEIAAN